MYMYMYMNTVNFLFFTHCQVLNSAIQSYCIKLQEYKLTNTHPIFIMRPKNKSKILEFVRCTSHDFNKDNNTLLLNRNLQYRNVS